MDASDLQDVADTWMAAMRRGDFAAAWRQTDRIEGERRRHEAAGTLQRLPHHLTWNGEPFGGKHVLVRCSHGLGDTIQFARYVPRVRESAKNLTFHVQPPLVQLFAGAPEYGDVRNGWTDEAPAYDVEIEVMELAYAFRSTVASLPGRVPYLPLHAVQPWRDRLPLAAADELKVGVLWCVSDWDSARSIPLDALEPLRRVRGVRFYSLQQGAAADTWDQAPVALEPLSEHTREITAAAAAMLDLDLVIVPDCMAAHLAGALGRRAWVVLLHEADWRWMEAGSTSPWYPTLRLYRQPTRDDWVAAMEVIATDLQKVVDDARAVRQ